MVMGQAVGNADVVVIGAGPGGYVAAIRAAQLGKHVILIDSSPALGGVCLHRGCIPSKALIHASEFLYHLDHADNMGITVDAIHFDPKKMQSWKASIIDNLAAGVKGLCDKHKIDIVHAKAYFQTAREIGLEPLSEDQHLEYGAIEFRHCIIATGSTTRFLPGLEHDGKIVVGSREMLDLDVIPKNFLVVGGGYIGMEMAITYAKFGSKVTIVEMGTRIVPAVDEHVSKVLEDNCKTLGIDILYETQIDNIKKNDASATVQLKGKNATTIEADKILVAIGRTPNTQSLHLENTHVELDDHGFIKTNDKCQTTDPHIFAVGDVAGGALLAHKASMEGRVAAEVIAGKPSAFDMQVVPAVIFTDPEIAMVGMTETEATTNGYKVKTGQFPFKASGRALTMNQPLGFVKVIADEDSHLILGVHIIGPNASDLISEAALAIEMGARIEDIEFTIHPHPSLSEALSEAVQSILGHSVHIFKH